MHYVALSKVRKSSKLHNLNEKKICISEKVKEEMARLREKPLVSCVPCLYNNDQPSRIKVLFHNEDLLAFILMILNVITMYKPLI